MRRRHQACAEDAEPCLQRHAHLGEEAGTKQHHAADQLWMAVLQGNREFAAPTDGMEENRAGWHRRLQEFGEVVEKTSESRCVAPGQFVYTRAAAIEIADAEARSTQLFRRILIPAAVTLNAVQAYDGGFGRAIGFVAAEANSNRRWR